MNVHTCIKAGIGQNTDSTHSNIYFLKWFLKAFEIQNFSFRLAGSLVVVTVLVYITLIVLFCFLAAQDTGS